MSRIEKLRVKTFDPAIYGNEFYYLFYKAYEARESLAFHERYGEAFYEAFSTLTPAIGEDELIVGSRNTVMTAQQEAEWETKYLPLAEEYGRIGGQNSHMAIDYELLLTCGTTGIMARIDELLLSCGDPEKIAFYKTAKRCLEAVNKHAENYANTALQLSRETENVTRKAELLQIAEICKKVPAEPANGFYEAVQSVHFITHCLSLNPQLICSQQFQLGHPDRYLLPYYEKDIAEGKLTKAFAQELLDCLGIQINMRVPNGLSSGYMVGGRDENGNIVANALTEMCMQVIDDIRLVYPSVGFCFTNGMPEKYLDVACNLLLKGYSHPAIFNDDVITKGLMQYGVDAKRAHSYIHSTCVEITPVAASNVWVASPYTNMPQLLLDRMDREYASFDGLINAIFAALSQQIRDNFEVQNHIRMLRSEKTVNPLLSCFVDDCLARGLDIEQGGAVYNWIMPSFVGMANLVDALYAIKQLVFTEKSISIRDLKAILDQNFEGQEVFRNKILNHIPKYGNDMDEIDSLFSVFTEFIVAECKKYSGLHSNGNLIPSVFCWVMHERFGRETGATADGRLAGFPLGDGSGPCQGREKSGPTASILSSTKWDHTPFIGGVAVNLKFAKSSLGANSAQTVKVLVKTYLERGGFETQINVVDNETLKKAQAAPEQYRDLVVRIGGYSDYFVKLSPQMQAELILRTAHTA